MTARTPRAGDPEQNTSSAPEAPLARTAADGTRTYHDETHRIAAVTGPAAAIRERWHQGYRDFDIYRSADGALFLLLRFDLRIENLGQVIATDPAAAGADWTRLADAELQRFIGDDGTQAG